MWMLAWYDCAYYVVVKMLLWCTCTKSFNRCILSYTNNVLAGIASWQEQEWTSVCTVVFRWFLFNQECILTFSSYMSLLAILVCKLLTIYLRTATGILLLVCYVVSCILYSKTVCIHLNNSYSKWSVPGGKLSAGKNESRLPSSLVPL